jgi:hypothetical protein
MINKYIFLMATFFFEYYNIRNDAELLRQALDRIVVADRQYTEKNGV